MSDPRFTSSTQWFLPPSYLTELRLQYEQRVREYMRVNYTCDIPQARYICREYYGRDPYLDVMFLGSQEYAYDNTLARFIHDPMMTPSEQFVIRQPEGMCRERYYPRTSALYKAIRRLFDEQTEGREHPQFSHADSERRPAGPPPPPAPQNGEWPGGTEARYPAQPEPGPFAGMDGSGVGAMGYYGSSAGRTEPGSGITDPKEFDAENHGRDRRAGGEKAEGYVKEGASCAALTRWIESQFNCRNGPYGAYVVHGGESHYYVTLSYLAKVKKVKDSKEQSILDNNAFEMCRNAMLGDFATLRDQFPAMPKPILYWRFHESQRFGEEINPSPGRKVCLRTRICIPGANYEKIPSLKPEGSPARTL